MFSVYNLQFPSEATLNHIYVSILKGHFSIFPDEIQDIVDKIVQMTLDLYKVSSIWKNDYKFHSNFSETREFVQV